METIPETRVFSTVAIERDPRPAPAGPSSPARRDFRLLRYFAVASLIAIVLAVLGLGLYFRHTALRQLIKMGEDNNVAVAQTLASALRPYYAPLIGAGGASAAEQARAAESLNRAVRDAVRETRVVAVRLSDSNGRAIYSSDSRSGDTNGTAQADFAAARAGTVITHLGQTDSFDAFGLVLPHPGVLTSYVPVRRAGTDAVEAVLGISTDVTPFYEQIRRTQMQLRFGTAIMLVLLYGALFFVVRRADRIITEQDAQRRRDADTIRYLAHHDELTGLPNRKLFADRLSCAVARAKRSGRMAALMFIDLDRFKEVNDTLGHGAGDRVLQAAGRRLRESLRTSDTVARMGGDEFTILLEDIEDLERVETVAQKIRSAFAAPVATADDAEVFVTPSIGITLYPRDADSAEGLLNTADAAMYDAKAAGRNAYRFYRQATGLTITPVSTEPARTV